MEEEKIFDKLKSYYEILCEKYGEDSILGVYLYGSQNYNFSDEYSDIDAKAIYVPSLLEISYNKPMISKELHTVDGAHIEIKDIRLMAEMLKKQNLNFLEILFTKYYYENPKYFAINSYWRSIREDISLYDRKRMLISVTAQASNTLKKTSGKNVAKVMYFYQFFTNLLDKEMPLDRAMKLTNTQKEELLYIKRKENCNIDEIKKATFYLKELQKKISEFKEDENLRERQLTVDSFFAHSIKKAILIRED